MEPTKWRTKAGVVVEVGTPGGSQLRCVSTDGGATTMTATMFHELFEPCPVRFEDALAHMRAGGRAALTMEPKSPMTIRDGVLVWCLSGARVEFYMAYELVAADWILL